MRLLNVDLLMALGFPSLNKKELIGLCLWEEIIVAVTSVLSKDGIKDPFLPHALNKILALPGEAFEVNVNRIHGKALLISFVGVVPGTEDLVPDIGVCLTVKEVSKDLVLLFGGIGLIETGGSSLVVGNRFAEGAPAVQPLAILQLLVSS